VQIGSFGANPIQHLADELERKEDETARLKTPNNTPKAEFNAI